MPIDKHLKEIEEADLVALKEASAREGKTIEFKAALNLSDQDAKRKFLASVASFANASGGDMIFGIRAVDGVAEEVVPLAGFKPDKDTLMLRDIIRSHIAPKIYGFDFKPITIAGGHALVLRIPKTWAGAHMVTFNEDNRFYVRDNNGRRSMDVGEVRAAILGSEAIMEKVKRYRQERLSNILADETPIPISGSAKFVLHIVPLLGFEAGFSIDLKKLSHNERDFRPISSQGYSEGRDIEGFYRYFGNREENWSYAHISTTGCIEAVDSLILTPKQPNKKVIHCNTFERELLHAFALYLRVLGRAKVDAPYAIMLSLLNVRGYAMSDNSKFVESRAHAITRDILVIPGTILDDSSRIPDIALKPLLDGVWHACGYWQSPNFTPEGKWQPQQ